jgi:rhomboid family GlyGly-CTERM serine protease
LVRAPFLLMKRFPFITISVALLASAVWLSPALRDAALFERAHIANGEWWRLLTGHLVHFSFSHLAFDLTVFAGAGWLIERQRRSQFVAVLLCSAFAVGTAILWFAPEMRFYGGMSGVAMAMVCFVAWRLAALQGTARIMGIVVLLMVAAKLIGENRMSQPLFANFGSAEIEVASIAHVAGALVGIIAGFVTCFGGSRDRQTASCIQPAGNYTPPPHEFL